MARGLHSGVWILATALAVSLTGCGGDTADEDPTGSATTTPAAESSGPTRTVEPEQSETVDPDAAMAEGSGCDPDPGALPDGLWFGTVEDITTDELELDIACWFIGEDAVLAAADDGEESPPPNDYYVRNTSTEGHTVPISPAATVLMHPTGSPDDQETGTVADLLAAAETRGGYPWGVWVEVEDGVVVDLQEQWTP